MFFGRDDLIQDLQALFKKRTASLVTCRGRRRVGKSTLIEVFAKRVGARFLKIEGLRPKRKMGNADELAHFAAQLSEQTGCDSTPPRDWLNAFARLDSEIKDTGRTVVLLDEVSWMAHFDKTFAGTLKVAWDNRFKKHPALVFVVCGSVSTWIRDNLIDDGSFYGRRSLDVVVPELPLRECVKFWGSAAERIAPTEIVDVLSVTGGVPRYLEEIDPGASAAENIRRLCFRPRSTLRVDFDEMFSDVVTRQPSFAGQALRALLGGARSVAEISAALGIGKGGRISDSMGQLAEAGLVAADISGNPATGRTSREIRYRLRDNYSRFYLRCIEPSKEAIDAGTFAFGSLDGLDGWDSVMELAFENLVVNNVAELMRPLGFSGAQLVSAAPWRRVASRSGARDGVQIDLLLQARRSLCVVEIKRRREIGRSVIDEEARKVELVPKRRGVSVRAALVYEGALAPIVEADGYFDAIVPFRRLLGL